MSFVHFNCSPAWWIHATGKLSLKERKAIQTLRELISVYEPLRVRLGCFKLHTFLIGVLGMRASRTCVLKISYIQVFDYLMLLKNGVVIWTSIYRDRYIYYLYFIYTTCTLYILLVRCSIAYLVSFLFSSIIRFLIIYYVLITWHLTM